MDVKPLLDSSPENVDRFFRFNLDEITENVDRLLRFSLDEITEKYSRRFDELIQECAAANVRITAAFFKIVALDNNHFAIGYDLQFDSEHITSTSTAVDAKAFLTPEAWQELQSVREKIFSADIPQPKPEIPSYTCRQKFNLTVGNPNLEKIKLQIGIAFLLNKEPFKVKIFTFGASGMVDTDAVEITQNSCSKGHFIAVDFESLVDLSKIPNDADKIYFVLVPDGGEYPWLGYVYLGVHIDNAYVVFPRIVYYGFEGHSGNPSPEAPFTEANLLIGELSREDGGWFFNAVVKDFNNYDDIGRFFGFDE